MSQNNTYNKITINNTTYLKEEIDNLKIDNDVQSFLAQWWDESNTIELQTSGSTGEPKTIEVDKSQMIASAEQTIKFFNLQPEMTALLSLPTSFIAGKMMIVRAIIGELNLITVPITSTPLAWTNREIDFAAFTPMQISKELIQNSKNLSLLKTVIVGGGKINNELNNLLQNAPFKAYETYGMTETLSHVALRKANEIDKQNAFFPICEQYDFKVSASGTLMINAAEITNGWVTTNDLVRFNIDGSFSILGRSDNIINSGGIKHSPEEIENKISHLIKSPFFISSLPDTELEEEIILIIEGESNNENKLVEEMKIKLSKYEQPKSIYYLPKFAYTTSGKIKRQETTEMVKRG